MMREFVAVWFEFGQEWIVMFPDGSVMRGDYAAIGYAVNAALTSLDAGESDFDCTEDTGTFYSYERSL